MKSLLFIPLIVLFQNAFSQKAGCPVNIDFELGNFTNWQCYIGSTDTANGQNRITLTPSSPTPGRHEITSALSFPSTDPYGSFPVVCPYGGKYSVKLGNDQSGGEAEGFSYTFHIPPGIDTFTISYYYAVVFQDPGHTPIEQPRFFVTAYEVSTGNLINCASYNYIAQGSIPGFKDSPLDPTIKYKDWSPVSIDFGGLADKDVRLEFKTADCTRGGHFGYAYVDVGSGCSGTLATATYCIGTNSVTLNAPYGFQTYNWFNDNYSKVVGNSESVTITPPPAANTIFHIDMIPYVGYGCRDTATAAVEPVYPPDTPVAQSEYVYCQNQYAQPIIASALSGNTLLWYTAATGGIANASTPIVNTYSPNSADYYVSQKQLFGCEGPRKKITVNVFATPTASFATNKTRQCQNNDQFVFTNSSTGISARTTYEWDMGDGTTSILNNALHNYDSAGDFIVKLKVFNPPSCSTQYTQLVTVVPKPIAKFNYPPVICENQTQIQLTDNSYVPSGLGSVNSWSWLINGALFTGQSPTPFTANPGKVEAKLVVSTVEGCQSDTTTLFIPVHYRPIANFSFTNPPLCDNEIIKYTDLSALPSATSSETVAKWYWQIDNTANFNVKNPSSVFSQGNHNIELIAESNFGCKSIAKDSSFFVNAKPDIQLSINDSCINRTIQYSVSTLPASTVSNWYWDFGKGFSPDGQIITNTFSVSGNNSFRVMGLAPNGCKDTIVRPFRIYSNSAFAGNDTLVAMGQPVQLNAHGGPDVNYNWIPSVGLNNSTIENPIAISNVDQLYELKAISIQGCDSYSKVFIKRFKGPDLYIPTAFTPNGDGLNDILKVFPVGIKAFYFFEIYNRLGQLVFYTTDFTKGWDGKIKGVLADEGSYVFVSKALDYYGNILLKKGNVLLLK